MPWILCPTCSGTQRIPVDEEDPNGGDRECPQCKDSSSPGHIYREFLA